MDLTGTYVWKGRQNYLCFADKILYAEIPRLHNKTIGSNKQIHWWLVHMLVWHGHGCPDIQSNFISVSVRVFQDINIGFSRLSKADCPLECWWSSSNQLKTWVEQKGWVRRNIACLTRWTGTLIFSFLWTGTDTISSPVSQAIGLKLELHYPIFWVSSFLTVHLGTFQPP